MYKKIKIAALDFYHQTVPPIDLAILLLLFIAFLIGLGMIFINTTFTHYTGVLFTYETWMSAAPVGLILVFLAMHLRSFMPRLGFILRTLTLLFLSAIVLQGSIEYGGQFTPFPIIDSPLIQLDQLMGFDSLTVLHWTYAHPLILKAMSNIYDYLILEIPLIIILLTFLFEEEALNKFMLANMTSTIVGILIYYFFPTVAPAGMFHDIHFSPSQLNTSIRFFQLHHYIAITSSAGGLIGFPSFHVMWAVLYTYACFCRKWLFYPILILNILVIISTVLLGWHYLMDVFGGILVALIGIYCAEKIAQKI